MDNKKEYKNSIYSTDVRALAFRPSPSLPLPSPSPSLPPPPEPVYRLFVRFDSDMQRVKACYICDVMYTVTDFQ